MADPFLTLITPTYKRPKQLAQCMASVQAQALAPSIEHIVLPDYVGRGIDGMYAEIARYRDAVHGEYVALLADDDELVPGAVEALWGALGPDRPDALMVSVVKGGGRIDGVWPPVCGQIDLGNLIVRRDVWQAHCDRYGRRYEGDFDFAEALHQSGAEVVRCRVLFMNGAVSHGRPEVAA